MKPIRTDADHEAALREIERLWGAEPGTDDGDTLEVLVDLVEHYESRHFAMEPLDGVDFLEAHMEANGYTRADLGRVIGSRSRATEVLNRQRRINLDMVRAIAREWRVPEASLIRERAPA